MATLADDFVISTEQEIVNTAIFMMKSFYYFDQNPSEVCFLVQIRPFAIQTSLRLPIK